MPRGLWTQFLDVIHAGSMNGHPGIEKTRLKLKEIALWRCWISDVRDMCGVVTSVVWGRRGPAAIDMRWPRVQTLLER